MKNTFTYIALLLVCHCGFSQPLFELKSSNQTGVNFNNMITDEKDHNILIYSNYYGGAGVGVGDFNNDGLQDLYFAGNLVHDKLYYNKGGLTFQDQTEAAGIIQDDGWSSSVIVVDINNDGWLDIYVTRELYDDFPEKRKNLLYVNDGSGNFLESAEQYGIDNSERTRHAVFLDINKDGLLDLYLLNQPPNPGNYSPFSGAELLREEWSPRLLQQVPGNKFLDVTEKSGLLKPCYPNSVSASDFNEDGLVDIYVANDYDSPDMLWQNNGDATFTNIINESNKHISYYSMGVDAADINNDSRLDIMTLDMVAEDNYRLKANMSGMNPERFWKLYESGGHRQYMFNNLHLNQGDNHYSDIAQMAGIASTDWSWSNLIADFDNDGWKDIHITNGLLRDIRNSDAAKAFPEYVRKVIFEYLQDHPNEGDVDIFDILDLDEALNLIPSVPLKNYFFLNNGDLTFTKSVDSSGLNQESFSNGSAYADLDNDGDLEIIVNNINAPAFIYENKSKSNWLRVKLNNANKPIYGSTIEISIEGKNQFYAFTNVRGMYSTSENIAHFGLGQYYFVDSARITWPDGKQTLLTDIEANQLITVGEDNKITIPNIPIKVKQFEVTENRLGITFRHQENMFDDYDKQVLLPHKMGNFGPAMAIGDVNNDGKQDIFFGGATGQTSELFVQSRDGDFKIHPQKSFNQDSLMEDMDASFIDIDNDGDLDLYVVSGGNAFPPQSQYYQDRLYINDGSGIFKKEENRIPRFRESGSVVRPKDIDNDGDLDLFIGGRHNPWDYPSPAISRLLINEDGVFKDMTKSQAPVLINIGLITDATWSDIDSDGDQDLILVGEWMNPTLLINNNGTFDENNSNISNFKGWLYSITAADLDMDGDDDYIIGNLGLNYKYKASEDEPFEVYYSDFNDNGSKDIVLSYYNYGERFPLRGRSCSSEQIPEIKEKFKNYDLFASSNLETVYGQDALNEALYLYATDFRSGVMMNNGKLDFKFIPFPNSAQISSINACVLADINRDGIPDIISSGNLYSSEIETPRNDAGIGNVLIGDGQGNFINKYTNLYIDTDSKKLKILQVNNKSYLISANNNDYPSIIKILK